MDSILNLLNKYGPSEIACIIVEPVILNCSMIKPRDGYLQSIIDLCREHDIVVIFDIVKLNTCVNIQQITQFWSEESGPDMYTLGKGLSGGACPVGAIGMTEEFAKLIEEKKSQISGTYSGNSLAVEMVKAVQTYVTSETQATLELMSKSMHDRCKDIIDKYNIPAIVDYIGNKGCITFLKKDSVSYINGIVKNYQDYIHHVDLELEALFTFFSYNRGLWIQLRDEWSLSYQHTMDDADLFVLNFEAFAKYIKDI